MEPEGSFPCLQEPSTGPYPEPDQSNPIIPTSLSKNNIQIVTNYELHGKRELRRPRLEGEINWRPNRFLNLIYEEEEK
jgi:hypothetical protein